MQLSNRHHYIICLDFKFKRLYIIWFSDEVDGVVVNEQSKLIAYREKNRALKFCEENHLHLMDDVTTYDIHHLQQWVLNPNSNFDQEAFLNFWNLFTDISASLKKDFIGNVKSEISDKIYNKLFDGSGIFIAEHPNPVFDNIEIVKLSEIMQNGLALLIDNLAIAN